MIRVPLNIVLAAAAAVGLSACVYDGEPLEDGELALPEGQYDYLEGELPYDTPQMTENEEELVEGAADQPRRPEWAAEEAESDPVLGDFDETLFDE